MGNCEQHQTPCTGLKNFRALVVGVMGVQAVFVIGALTITVNTMSTIAAHSESLMQLKTRQEMIEKKADVASADASKALAVSGKAESNIAWIREGLTELKIAVRSGRYTPSNQPPTTTR